MKKITMFIMAFLAGQVITNAQSSCTDLNAYPQSKNVSTVGAYTLTAGSEENAAQTYHYSGPGRITGVRVYGTTPNLFTGVDLAVKVYTVDANGRPVSSIGQRITSFDWLDNFVGYKDVTFSGSGISTSANFAVSIEILNGITGVTKFMVSYNGNGEGHAEDLASLAGTSTGGNWASAMTAFNKDGDFYIVPKMRNSITSNFTPSTACATTTTSILFTNTTQMSRDSMFNQIGLSHYTGGQTFYSWNFGDLSTSTVANPSHTYATAGVYTVSLTSKIVGWQGTCSHMKTMQISVGLTASYTTLVPVSCYGSSNGSFVAVGTGGATPYTYSLNGTNYQSSTSFTGLSYGNYTLYVKDATGCIKTTVVSVSQPTPIVIAPVQTTNASCGNADGAILATATGGIGTLQYSLDNSTWQATGSFTNKLAGGYTVYVKDANGCSTSANVVINDFGGPTLTINSYTNISCYGNNNGSIVASATGGTGTYQYSKNGINFQLSGTFNNLVAGTYNITVKDAAGCMDIKTIVLGQPSLLVFTANAYNVSCNFGSDGSITVTSVIGGTGIPVFSLNNVNYQSSNVFNGLVAGTYTIYVKDVAGCTANSTIVVSQPTPITIAITSTNSSCNNSNDGSITATATGGTPGYTYSINGSDYYPTGDFSELGAGTYSVMTKDAHGCTAVINAVITQPTPITATITSGNSTCGNSNGNILAIAAGGSGSGYQYSLDGNTWNSTGSFTSKPAGIYVVIVKDGTGCENIFHVVITDSNGPVFQTVSHTNISCNGGHDGTITVNLVTGGSGTLTYRVDGSPYQLSTVFTNLAAGDHIVEVKDGVGCVGSYSVSLTEPAPIVVTAVVVNNLCYGGTSGIITVTAGGGSGTLAYELEEVTSWQGSNVFSGLAAGTYIIDVKDAGGCMGSTVVTVTQPPIITIAFVGTLNVTCFNASNGSIFIGANGGTGTLQYSLNGNTYQTSNTFSNLSGGVYTVYVKDANGCVVTTQVTIDEPAALALTSNAYNVTCAGGNDGVVNITVNGGTGPYTYVWSNSSTTEDIFNLAAGSYSVVVTDANGCTSASGFTITQPNNPLIVNGNITNATGNNTLDGSINITVTGGTPPYSYNWSNGSTTQDITGVNPGAYIVTITDANGCVTSGIFTVNNSVGISENALDASINVYPNPANDYMTFDAGSNRIDRIEIYNVVGEMISTIEPKSEKALIDVTNLSEGMYFAKLIVGDNSVTKKIQVVK